MGILSKIVNKIYCKILKGGIIEDYKKFLTESGEFNSIVHDDSFDVNYSIEIFNDFLKKYNPPTEGEDYGCYDYCRFIFEESLFEIYMFKHYARALTVSMFQELDENCNLSEIYCLCNTINSVDLIHQIGVFTFNENNKEKHYLRITKQILCTPNICDTETMAQSFRDLKEYFLMILDMNFPDLKESDLSAWKKYSNIVTRTEVDNAEEFWFTNRDTALSDFRKTSKVFEESENEKKRTMINMLDGSVMLLGTDIFLNGIITTYKQYPYLVSMSTSITEGVNGIPNINIEKAAALCASWNGKIHFSPLRIVMNLDSDKNITVSIIMTGLCAEECNTRTFVDFLCTLQKTTSLLTTIF